MPLQKLPVTGLNDENHRRRARETLNKVLDHSFDDSRRQTAAEKLAGVTPVNYAYPPGDVRRYGADESGAEDSTAALNSALLANTYVFFPAGTFLISNTITVPQNRVITGESGGSSAGQASRITFTGNGRLFDASGGGFGYLYIGHLYVSHANDRSGSHSAAPCIYCDRPQFIIEFITMEGSLGYDNPGINIENSGVATTSFSSVVRNCKWVGPYTLPGGVVTPTPVAYSGFEIEINGGHVGLDDLTAIFGNVGIDVQQGQAIVISRPIVNRQYADSSSESGASDQCGVRLSGSLTTNPGPPPHLVNYHMAVSITGGYFEACTRHIYVKSCESCTIADNLIQDVGFGTEPAIEIANGDAQCVTVRNNVIDMGLNNAIGVLNGSENGTVVMSNRCTFSGTGAYWLSTSQRCDYGYNYVVGATLADPGFLAYQMEGSVAIDWTPTIGGSSTAGTQTYTLQVGRAVITKRTVQADFVVILSAKDVATAGNLMIFGLPRTSRNNSSRLYNCAIGAYSNLDLTAGKTQVGATVSNNATTIVLIESGDNVAFAPLTAAALQDTTAIYGSVTYEI